MRPPSFWPGSICHLPPIRGGSANQDGVGIGKPAPIPISICASPDILVNSPPRLLARNFTLTKNVFRSLFSKKKAPLSGAPTVRRMKTYSAQSGYVYQYFYEGHRDYRAGGEDGVEFVFTVSSDRKASYETSVLVSNPAIRAWEQGHGRELSLTERYAVAKIALFQAFDERPDPAQLRDEVRVRNADVEGIVETLGL
jgi:hypothetical protein